jgi:hypothetical protein
MKNNILRITPFAGSLSLFALYALLVLLAMLGYMKVESSVTIAVATTTAAIGWIISSRIKARSDIEASASKEIITALEAYSGSLRTFYYGMITHYEAEVSSSSPLPNHFWENAAVKYYSHLFDDYLKVRESEIKFREAIEANEMALIDIEDLYDYIKFKHDDLINLFDKQGKIYANRVKSVNSYHEFKSIVEIFVTLNDKAHNTDFSIIMAEQLMLCLDLKKIILNKFQSKIFGRRVATRKPLNGTKTLKELATKKVVKKMREERQAEFTDYLSLSIKSSDR